MKAIAVVAAVTMLLMRLTARIVAHDRRELAAKPSPA